MGVVLVPPMGSCTSLSEEFHLQGLFQVLLRRYAVDATVGSLGAVLVALREVLGVMVGSLGAADNHRYHKMFDLILTMICDNA